MCPGVSTFRETESRPGERSDTEMLQVRGGACVSATTCWRNHARFNSRRREITSYVHSGFQSDEVSEVI